MGADTIRFATYNTDLSRRGPGLLLADILSGDDPQVLAVLSVISHVKPDVIALQGIDYDTEGHAVLALADALSKAGHAMPHVFAGQPNTGVRTGLDHDGDGRTDGPRDTQGFGRFTGEGGMAVLSRFPIEGVTDLSSLIWADLPNATLPPMAPERAAIQRLSTTAHWDVAISHPSGAIHLLSWHATPPIFDGPEDFNGLRNRDEFRLWQWYLDGVIDGLAPPDGRFVIAGDANVDPMDGDGRSGDFAVFLTDPRLQDPAPQSDGARTSANDAHQGDPALDTVDWNDPDPGNLRVDYVLPSRDLKVVASGVFWPPLDAPLANSITTASRHRLVWVDIALN